MSHDPNFGYPNIRKIKAKKLFNKITRIHQDMHGKIMGDLQFESQDMETKRDFYKAVDHIKAFLDNIL